MERGPWQGPNATNTAAQATGTRRWCIYMINLPEIIAAGLLLYDTTRYDDYPGVRFVFAGLGRLVAFPRADELIIAPFGIGMLALGVTRYRKDTLV